MSEWIENPNNVYVGTKEQFHEHKSVGNRIEIPLDPGDMYVMSEKAVGADWKKVKYIHFRTCYWM